MFFKQNQTTEIKKFYSQNGFAVIRDVFKKKDIVEIKKSVFFKLDKNNNDYYFEKSGKKNLIRRIERITDYFSKIKNLAYSQKIFKILKISYINNVLFKDKLNFKFDKSTKKNGCLFIANKNDTKKLGQNWEQITKKLAYNTPNISRKDFKKFKFYPIEVNTGDIVIFDWKCAHYSTKNMSKSSRMILYLTYCQSRSKNIRKRYYSEKMNSQTNENFKGCIYKKN